ncbi:MAG: filamentous hemagglutinin N-terminal domain-containing protein, partial [Gammaproteobacteria bacterium]|nr:filamentous hemagglutinin N-terminal domain-containing protein [Gammaproteobacteria bacterium]
MNKRCYKVIFSKTLNCLVVVSEWAKSSGKSDNRTSSPQPKQIFNSTCRAMQRLSVSVLLSLGLATLSFSASADGIFEDVTAPRNQQPMVTQTASGVPQVNIQTPSAAGVSMNQYSQFDVDKKGAVLANNRKATKAQIAGWVDANPYMARGEADVIVNQVNGNNPSQLNGYVEVAGKRADVIIANPSGIAVNGGGFLNVNKTILSTGQTQLSDGKVTGHSINQGEITIAGQGLDVRDGNYTALLSRSAEINAGIYKGDGKLDVITGVNDVDASGNITHSTAVTNDDKKPTVAIDTGKLGGMYAGSIRLVGTETGVGVNNAGQIQTNQLTLSADGTLSNSGQVVSETSNITSTSLDNSGTINTGELQLSTSKIANSGSITQTGSQSLTITAQNLTNSGGVGISKNKSDTANHSANTPDKTSSTTDNQSPKNFADGHINVTESIENTGNITAGGEVVLDLNDGLSNSGTVKVEKATLENGKLDNSGELFINQANLNGATFNNTIDGSINIDKADAFNFTQRIDNAGQISVTDKINWDTQQFNNTDTGTIYTDKTFTLTTQQTDNAGQLIADDNVSIKSKKTTNTGKVQSQKQLSVTGSRLENKEKGQLTAKQIKIDNATINNAGEINQVGNGHLAITTDSLTNDGNVGKLLQTSKASTDKTDTSTTKKQDKATDKTTDKQSSGTTDANGSITSQQLTNTGSIVNNGKTSLTVSETLTNKAKGSIDVNTLNATTKQLDNSGSISADDATLSGKTFNNSGALSAKKINTVNYSTKINNTGELVGKDTFTIQSPLLFNSGKINGAESIQFSTDDWTNKGTVIAEQNITIANGQSASDKVINSGILTAGKKIGIKSSTLANNTKGSIQSNHLVIASDNAVNDGKIIQTGSNDLSITADTVANKKGAVLGKNVSDTKAKDSKTTTTDSNASDKQADSNNKNIGKTTGTLTVSNTLINTGQLVAGGDVSLATDTKLDNQGQINVSQLTHKSGELNNSGGQLTADTMSLSGKTLDNNKGTLQANTFSQFNFVDKIDNQAGKIIGQADYSISTQRLDNTQKGSVSGANNLDIKADNVDTDGSIIAGKNLSITGDSQKDSHITNQGDISAHQKLTVNTKKVANKSESAKISAKTLQITTDNLTNKGTISQTDDASLLITAKNISNNESASLGAAVSEASATVNTASKSDTKAKPSNTASGYITVADSITNDNAINAGGKTSITATDKLSNAGTIKTNKLNVQGQLSNNKTIITDDAAIDVSQLDNQGEISAEKFNTLNATDFSNTGKIQGKESYTVNAKQIKNTGKNSQLTSDNALTIHSDTIENQGVVVAKSSTLDVAESLVNDGTIHAEKDVTVTGKDASITNSGAIQSASASLDVQAKSLTNQTGGRLFAAQDATLDVAEKIKNSGDVHANNLLKLFAQSLENHKKAAFSSKDLIIKSDTVDNAGTIRSTVLSATTNQLNNTGDVNAKQLTAKADTLSNTGVIRADNTSVEGSTLTNHGTLTAKKFNKIDFATLINSGILFGVKDYIINAKILKNTGGDSQISTTEKLTIKADTVHNEGKVAAKAQEIKVSEKLDNVGTIYADTSVTIDSDKQATITNSSVIQAGQSLDIDAKTLDNKKTLVAGKNIQLDTADNLNNSGTINAKTLEVSTVSLDNTGNIQQTSTGNLQITANKTINKKDAVLGQLPKTDNKNEKKTTSPNVDKDTQTSPSHITVTGTLNNAGTITGNGKVSLDTKEGLQNQGKINLDTFSLSSGVLDNQSGILQAQAMDFDASQLLNAKGLLTAKKFTNFVFSNGIDNKAGTISGQEDFSIRTDATFDNTEDGKVFAGDNLTIKANQLDNAGKVFSINTLSLAIKKALNNKKNISAQQLVISADSLANQGTITQSGKGNMVIGADSIINRKNANLGSALATKTTSTDKGGKDNTDSITADGLITVNHLLDNAGNIVASGNTDITAHNGLDNQGVIKAKNLTSQQGEFSNTNKVLADTASINSSTLTNSGELSAKTFIHVKADQLTNSGKIIGTDSYVIDAKKLTNKGKDSSLASQNTLTTKATTITNEGLIEAKQQTINVTDALTNSGTIDAENKLSVSGGKTANITNKKLIQSKTSDVAITGKSLKNTSATATIYAGGKLDVATEKAVNNAGTMSSAETLTVKADSLTNTNKATIQAKTTDITVTKQLANDGTISAKTKQTLKAQQLINKGTLGATEEQKIDVDQLDNQNIITTGKLTITSDTLNNSGSITQTGSRNLAISAGTLENKETIGHEARATPLPKENSNVTTPPADAGKIAVTGKVTNKGTINAGG